ncbi:enoyl-CoA hydratase/carnithine racemase [Variovorax sp. 54]|uniref:enoyl-CoA hydratase-related protein n=1 Tax=Variovorax sp. 54 TaxID=2035212 RepID=UPI000C17DE3A|nr:enoyl-CoA hydratase-related protein [Variovorax sp. 54]PIF73698.1 enoyl-CoA hydratase/carnithine racemase [Variovorax sp. 54]
MSTPVTSSTHGRIGVITVHAPPVNALSQAVRAGLLEAVRRGGEDPALDALVLRCEGRTFIVGADIREFDRPMQAPHLAEVVRAVAQSAKPVIAAMHGTALGGGFELALACQFRVALASAQVGLPEVKLGILPGCGGTQRLPRLIGVDAALRLIVEGDPIGAAQAMALGAIDAVIDGDLLAGSLAFAEEVVAGKRPMRPVDERPIAQIDLQVFDDWEKRVATTYRGFLAPAYSIQAIRGACELTLTEGLAREDELTRALLASPQSAALRHLFFAEREARKGLGTQSVRVGICDGFIGNRMLARRSREGFFMREEGATPWQIDKVLFDFGFPMGPYAMSDLADPDTEALIVAHSYRRGLVRRPLPDAEILERCLFAMINEGARILEEGVALRALDIDVVWVHGFGFPRYRGGPMFHADQIGLKHILRAMQGYQQTLGAEHWTPSPLLARLASEGKGFYSL